MRNLAREPRTYELLTILSPDVPEEEIPGALERISSYVTGAGGSVDETLRDSPWGRRRLAYPIRHAGRDVRDGYYTLFHLSLPPTRVEEMERELKLNTQVIRYLVTSYAPKPLDPRAIEDAEFAAEDAAAAAYAAAQAEAARLARAADASEDAAAAAYAASQAQAAQPATANAAAEANEAGASSAEAATAAPAAQAPEPTAAAEPAPATETAPPVEEPTAEAPVAAEPPPAERAGVGADQPIQGAAGVAGQPVDDETAGTGALAPGVARAEAEAPDAAEAAGTSTAESDTPTEES